MKQHAGQIIHFLFPVGGIWKKKKNNNNIHSWHNIHFQQHSELSASQYS